MDMNRNQFMLIGLVVLLLGVQLRVVDTFVLNEKSTRFLVKQTEKMEKQSVWSFPASVAARSPIPVQRKKIQPPKWLGWALISVGAVLVLHSLGLKKPD